MYPVSRLPLKPGTVALIGDGQIRPEELTPSRVPPMKTTGERACARGRSRKTGDYLRCLLTSLVISNIDTWRLPPNTSLSLSSALIMRLFLLSCRPLRLM